jgi:hypothetical protein
MKKKFLIPSILMLLCTITASADKYKPVSIEQLPNKARHFIATYFKDVPVSLSRLEIDVLEASYDVIFTDGSKLEFDRKGNWTEVDCVRKAIPAGIVPDVIAKHLRKNYPDATVTKIERNRHEIEVRLSNRLELTYNKKGILIDIDDD